MLSKVTSNRQKRGVFFLDPHDHIMGVLGWRGVALSYLTAHPKHAKATWASLDAVPCSLKPEDYGRAAEARTGDLCFMSWVVSTYEVSDACDVMSKSPASDDTCPSAYLSVVRSVIEVARKLMLEAFSDAKFDGTAGASGSAFRVRDKAGMNVSDDGFHQGIWQLARLQWGSQTLLPLVGCLQDATELEAVENLLESTLSASPQVDFDAAYVAREVLRRVAMRSLCPDCPTSYRPTCRGDKCAQARMMDNYWLYSLQSLLANGIRNVQWSHPICQLPLQSCEATLGDLDTTFPYFAAMGSCISECQLWEGLYKLLISAETRVPAAKQVNFRFMAMLLSSIFGLSDAHSTHQQQPTVFDAKDKDGGGRVGPMVSYYPFDLERERVVTNRLLEQPHVFAIDYASPERTVYNLTHEGELTFGGEQLQKQADALLAIAKAKRKRTVMHIHAGEGAGVYDYKAMGFGADSWTRPCDLFAGKPKCAWAAAPDFGLSASARTQMCAAASLPYTAQPAPRVHWRNGEPLHYIVARANLWSLVDFWEHYRKRLAARGELSDFDENVVVQLGHMTHANRELGKRLKALKIWGDLCLLSNLATGAVIAAPAADAPTYYREVDAPVQRFLGRLASYSAKVAKKLVPKLYSPANHYVSQIANCVSLGTDGSGEEHSGAAVDTWVARRFSLRAFRRNGKKFAKWISGRGSDKLTC